MRVNGWCHLTQVQPSYGNFQLFTKFHFFTLFSIKNWFLTKILQIFIPIFVPFVVVQAKEVTQALNQIRQVDNVSSREVIHVELVPQEIGSRCTVPLGVHLAESENFKIGEMGHDEIEYLYGEIGYMMDWWWWWWWWCRWSSYWCYWWKFLFISRSFFQMIKLLFLLIIIVIVVIVVFIC